jgi:hypothetical protein
MMFNFTFIAAVWVGLVITVKCAADFCDPVSSLISDVYPVSRHDRAQKTVAGTIGVHSPGVPGLPPPGFHGKSSFLYPFIAYPHIILCSSSSFYDIPSG